MVRSKDINRQEDSRQIAQQERDFTCTLAAPSVDAEHGTDILALANIQGAQDRSYIAGVARQGFLLTWPLGQRVPAADSNSNSSFSERPLMRSDASASLWGRLVAANFSADGGLLLLVSEGGWALVAGEEKEDSLHYVQLLAASTIRAMIPTELAAASGDGGQPAADPGSEKACSSSDGSFAGGLLLGCDSNFASLDGISVLVWGEDGSGQLTQLPQQSVKLLPAGGEWQWCKYVLGRSGCLLRVAGSEQGTSVWAVDIARLDDPLHGHLLHGRGSEQTAAIVDSRPTVCMIIGPAPSHSALLVQAHYCGCSHGNIRVAQAVNVHHAGTCERLREPGGACPSFYLCSESATWPFRIRQLPF